MKQKQHFHWLECHNASESAGVMSVIENLLLLVNMLHIQPKANLDSAKLLRAISFKHIVDILRNLSRCQRNIYRVSFLPDNAKKVMYWFLP